MPDEPTQASPPATPATKRPWGWFALLLVLIALTVGANIYLQRDDRPLPKGADLEAPAELTFDGESANLKASVLLPTLERPIPPGKSAIWCATLPMAWQELEKTVVKGPLDIQGVEGVCRELRDTPDAGLEPKDFYVAAGLVEDGIAARIQRELPQRFPSAPVPPVPDNGALAVAYLEVSLFYDYFFKHSAEPLPFKDAAGRTTPVHAFGIRKEDAKGHDQKFREQVLVLFRDKRDFALDLSHNTKPYQIILASVERKATLKETLIDLEKWSGGEPQHLGGGAILLIPSMNWKVRHSYSELAGRSVSLKWPVGLVQQFVQFKMDRKGAYVASMLTVTLPNGHPEAAPDPNQYLFNRPFLIMMRKRGSRQPFFAMWVDNAELMQKH